MYLSGGSWFGGNLGSVLQHQAKELGQDAAAALQLSKAASWEQIALLFLSPEEIPEKRVLLPDATWTPNVPRQRGEGCPARFHPFCPLPPQLSLPSSPICPRAGQLPGFKRRGQVLRPPLSKALLQPPLLSGPLLSLGPSLCGLQRAETQGKKAPFWDFILKYTHHALLLLQQGAR